MGRPCQWHLRASSTVVVGLQLLLFTGCLRAIAGYTAVEIQLECSACDVKALGAIATFGSDYGNWSRAIDGARYHCGRFAQAISCYTDCLHGTTYTYTSETKLRIQETYASACDPACYYTVVPYCYLSTVGSFDLFKSCTGSHINENLDRCLHTELFVNQNCNRLCAQGQRFTHINYFNTIFLCKIPYNTATQCFTWIASCHEQVYGQSSTNLVHYSNAALIRSNQLACSRFADEFSRCVQQGISGDVTVGTYPYTDTYRSPCAALTAEINDLVDYNRNVLLGPLCQNPSATFNDTCNLPATQRTTTAATRTTAVGHSVATVGYSAIQIQQECKLCDTRAVAAIAAFRTEYGNWNQARDGANYHCGRFAQAMACYTDCLHGTVYTYSSETKLLLKEIIDDACDPACTYAVIPFCYLSTVGTNDVMKSCSGSNIKAGLDQCLQRELFINQDCKKICTKGQRFTHINYFATMYMCAIPYDTASECFLWTFNCMEQVYGASSEYFVSYSDKTLIDNNQLACSKLADEYSKCVQKAIDGSVVIGKYPYTATYYKPCARLTGELQKLLEYNRNVLLGPLCQNPYSTFNETCNPSATQRTTTTATKTTAKQGKPRTMVSAANAVISSSYSTVLVVVPVVLLATVAEFFVAFS